MSGDGSFFGISSTATPDCQICWRAACAVKSQARRFRSGGQRSCRGVLLFVV